MLLVTMPMVSSAQEVTNPVCVSASCGSAGSSSASSSSDYGPPSIAWGGMTKRISSQVRDCGGAPMCALARAAVGYPIAFVFDAPVFAVKGLARGLYYGAKGIGFIGKKIGQGIAYPFKDHPQPPPTSWEAYKKQVLRLQKRLAKREKTNRENYVWCKGHVPLSHGPSRGAWESRCNPGDVVSRASLPIDVRSPNAGETSPLGLPKDAAADSTTLGADTRYNALVGSGMMPPRPEAATPTTESRSPAASAAQAGGKTPASSPPAALEPSGTSPAASAESNVLSPDASPVPISARQKDGAPAELPPSAKPSLKDPGTVLKQSEEAVKEAGAGGFESKEGMLGEKGKDVLKAFETTAAAPNPKGDDFQAAVAAFGRQDTPYIGPARAPAPGSSKIEAAAALPVRSSAPSLPLVTLGPDESLIGDLSRGRSHFHSQHGGTCVLLAVKQLLGVEGVSLTEDALFEKAFASRAFHAEKPCPGIYAPGLCSILYDASTGLCQLSTGGIAIGPQNHALCAEARENGQTNTRDATILLQTISGKTFEYQGIPLRAQKPELSDSQYAEIQKHVLKTARDELRQAISAGKLPMVTLEASTVFGYPNAQGLHTVAVPALITNKDGRIIAYVINDSGSGTQRRISRKVFEKAWGEDNLQRTYRQ